ncbi:MAG: hypothetical protein M3299_10175 [Thermoproteota archaeon]|nr:hypothetical protein [Thermoproteota archaeon]
MQGKINKNAKKGALLSRVTLVTGITTTMFLALLSTSPYLSILSLQQQEAEASILSSSFRLGQRVLPPAYIIVDGKASRLQLDNNPLNDGQGIADYTRRLQGTISFGERFGLLIPQPLGIFKDAQRATLTVCSDEECTNDDFHIDKELVNARDTRYWYLETHIIDAPGGGHPDALGDGFTASEVGFKIFMWWDVGFTDGTEQTYLAIVHLRGDPCEEHGWDYSLTTNTKCVDLDV